MFENKELQFLTHKQADFAKTEPKYLVKRTKSCFSNHKQLACAKCQYKKSFMKFRGNDDLLMVFQNRRQARIHI